MATRRGPKVHMGNCIYCGKPVKDKTRAYYQIKAWVSAVGGKGSKLAESTGTYAHDICVNEQIYDPNAGQISLL